MSLVKPGRAVFDNQEGGEDEDMPTPWAVTMADMFTLLMSFFALLFAMSTPDQHRFDNVMTAVQSALGGGPGQGGILISGPGAPGGKSITSRSLDELTGLEGESVLEDIKHELKNGPQDDSVQVVMQGEKVVLRVGGHVLFPSGTSNLSDNSRAFMDRIVRIVKSHPEFRVDIKGHTDPRPINSARYESNWELSALRATAVLRYLLEHGISPQRLTATGYADTEPLVSNTSEENMAKNRRVEFVLEKKEK